MKTYIIQLETHDDVISTRDKISFSKARRVLLLWPRHGKILERQVDLLLIQRYSQELGAQVALVTKSGMVKTHARELGIPVFGSPIKAQKNSWRTRRARKIGGIPEGRRAVQPEALRRERESYAPPARLRLWARISAFAAGVLALLALLLFFGPSAEITLKPVEQQQKLSINLVASPEVLAPGISGGIPAYAEQVMVEGSDLIASSGVALVPDRAAEGDVEFTNLTDQPLTIPVGSVVLTGEPVVRFITLEKAVFSGSPGETVVTAVRAALPGSQGNVGMSKIRSLEGPLGLRARVTNPEATAGGSDRTSPSPLAKDEEALRGRLVAQLTQTALDEIAAQVGPGKHALAPSLLLTKTLKETREPELGQPGDRLRLSLQAEFEAWYVTDEDVQAVARGALDATLPEGFAAGDLPVEVRFDGEPVLEQDGTVRWPVTFTRAIRAKVPEEQVLRLAQGREPGEAARVLQASLPVAERPSIRLVPGWWVRMPFFLYRMQVVQP